jgi:ribosomal protein L19
VKLCAIIDFDAIDNKIEFSMNQIKTKGTEQYWGTVMVSIKTKNIESAQMYSGTIQEIEVAGMKDKILVKTIRELEVNRIQ